PIYSVRTGRFSRADYTASPTSTLASFHKTIHGQTGLLKIVKCPRFGRAIRNLAHTGVRFNDRQMKGYWRRGVFLLLGVAAFAGLAGCKQRDEEAVARSYDTYLYRKDLAGIVPEGVTGEDSIRLARAYIDQWLRQQAVLVQAQRNVKANSEHIEKQVEAYRDGLIVYEYEQALISQKLDTVVTKQAISNYYD